MKENAVCTNRVFFDLDGTLTDPKEGIVRCLQYALRQLRQEEPPEAELVKYIGPPLRETFTELLGWQDRVEEAVRLYRERFSTIGLFENAVYPGVVDLLEKIRTQGWLLDIVTSKPTVYARQIVGHFRLSPYFQNVYGSELDGRFDEKTELIAHILQTENLRKEQIVMVGDRKHDIEAARAHGIATIGVTYGYGSREELCEAGAHWVCDSPEDLYMILLKYFRASVL